jgi:hypothetical protein
MGMLATRFHALAIVDKNGKNVLSLDMQSMLMWMVDVIVVFNKTLQFLHYILNLGTPPRSLVDLTANTLFVCNGFLKYLT